MTAIEAALRWWLALSVFAVALAPLTWWLAAGLGPFRHALLRPVGLVLGTCVLWWPAALLPLPFSRLTVIVAVSIAGVASWSVLWLRGKALLGDFRTLVVVEIVWIVAFTGYLWFRSTNPDIANTEKPMEIALLSSIFRSSEVPAPDPWFAGSPINYYYFGYQTVAALAHLAGVEPAVAFNLALGMLFASTLVVAGALGAWLARRCGLERVGVVAAGLLAGFFVTLAGNLETAIRLLRDPRGTLSAGWWDGVGWQASRVISDTGANGDPSTINEFPAFSFVLGDLHPHVMTLPVLLACIALAASLALNQRLLTYTRVAAVGAFAGLLYASNSWDAPVGIVVVVGAIVLAFRAFSREVLLKCAIAVSAGALAALPFAINYTAPVGVENGDVPGWPGRVPLLGSLPDTIAIVTWRPSSAGELLIVNGVWVFAFVLFAAWAIAGSSRVRQELQRRTALAIPAGLVVLAIAVAWAPAVLFLGLPVSMAVVLAVLHERPPVRLTAALFAAGFGLALVPEFLYIQDSFGNRMNTVFKLGFQAWLFLAVASAVALLVVVSGSNQRWRRLALGGLAVLALAASPYALLSAEDWMEMGVAGGTLDGAAYLEITNPAEAAAIAWLDREANDGDLLVEAPGCAYGSLGGVPMNRFSAFTGVPALMGWRNHEGQWRRGEFEDLDVVMTARTDLAVRWLSGDVVVENPRLEPRFIVMGTIERNTSERCAQLVARGEAEIARLQVLGWVVAFQEGETTILVRSEDPLAARAD